MTRLSLRILFIGAVLVGIVVTPILLSVPDSRQVTTTQYGPIQPAEEPACE